MEQDIHKYLTDEDFLHKVSMDEYAEMARNPDLFCLRSIIKAYNEDHPDSRFSLTFWWVSGSMEHKTAHQHSYHLIIRKDNKPVVRVDREHILPGDRSAEFSAWREAVSKLLALVKV